MNYHNKKQIKTSIAAIIVCFASIVLDIILVSVLKDKTPICRWLWLPLISLALAIIATWILSTVDERSAITTVSGIAMLGWGIIRGFIVVVAYFRAASGFGAIFLCIFMLLFNALPYVSTGGGMLMPDSTGKSAPSDTNTYKKPTPPPRRSIFEPEESNEDDCEPQRGDLSDYFRSYACAPQSGSMYFWDGSPSMSSSFNHSRYTITGTIGIKQKSVDAFHVTSTDLDHYLRSVERDIESYVDEMISDYRKDFPNDDTDFCVDIELRMEVLNW